MRRRLSLVIMFVGVLGLIGLSPASATHTIPDKGGDDPIHEDQPRPVVEEPDGGACAVFGTVAINNDEGNGGVSDGLLQRDHNHFRFETASITCEDVPGGDDTSAFAGAYEVDAAGGTDGPGGEKVPDGELQGTCDPMSPKKGDGNCHGELASAGWSHGDCYAGNCAIPKPPTAKADVDDLYDGTNTNPPVDPTAECSGGGATCNLNEILVERNDGTAQSCQNVSPINPDNEQCANWLKFCRGTHSDHNITDAMTGAPVPDCGNTHDNDGNLTGGTHASTGGGNILAWGALTDWDHPTEPADTVLCFIAELELEPLTTKVVDNGQGETVVKIDSALLEGMAQTWLGDSKEACDGKKN